MGGGVGTHLEFGILGPLEVKYGETAVRIGGPRQRALLALLLCHANQVVSRGQLIDELLSDQPADSAEPMLRVQISRLRKALADSDIEPRVLARPPGYLLRVADGELDLETFERWVADGLHALGQGDHGQAAVLLRKAESLWRGRPLADLEFERFARSEIQRLEALRLGAMEERIEAELALGRHTALRAELERLIGEHPLNERLRGQFMLALYRSGRQADALEAYRAGRSLLIKDLGIEPGPALKRLQLAILAQDTALDLPHPPAARRPESVLSPAEESSTGQPGNEMVARTHRHRARRAVVLAGVCAAAAIAALAPLASRTQRHEPLSGNLLALISPDGGGPRAIVPLQAPPTGMAAGSGSLWIAEANLGLVVRVSLKQHVITATMPAGTHPGRILATGGQVWVLDPVDRTLSRIDPQTNTVAQTIALAGQPSDVLASRGSLWVANRSDGTVLRIDPGTGRIQSAVKTGGDPSGLATAGGAVWVATDQSGTVKRIDARTGAVTATIRVGDAPAAIAATAGGLWVLDPLDATISRVDLRRGVTATVPLGGAPAMMAQSGGFLWIADRQLGTLSRLAPQRAAVTRFRLSGHPIALTAAAAGGLWVAVRAAGANHRGGTLTSINSAFTAVNTIDPGDGTSPAIPSPQFLGLTNDGLVTLDHVAGPAGARLVPDLALALPVATSDGRTYTFHLRPGIRYSTGELVKPGDVTHSFERLFQLGSSGASFYQAILGATECHAAPRTCDLTHGIAADNRTGTVTFHLTRPDPDFIYKLTLTYADVLPASIPGRQPRAPLPATGPYMIRRYIPAHEVLLVRNPWFREWSAAAQPAGYPDQILIRLGLSPAQGAAAIMHGRGDFMSNIGQIPAGAPYFLRHRSQLQINPFMATSFLFLNMHAPPFNQLRVRQAVNLALDRRQIVTGYGGPLAAQPTCQILPPQLPGYRRYCPYTRHPTADGRWHGPDLARARRLVAASGTAGMKVTVWNGPGLQATIDETRDTVTALRQLGYHASVRLLPASTYYAYTNDSRNHAQVIDGGWSTDYPSSDDFIGKLTCGYFVPGNGPATTDDSEFCDPAFDEQVAHAAALQATDPLAAAALWAQLDRELTDLAIWLPTVTSNETDLISQRIGNYLYNPVWGALIDQLLIR